jgi:hypothetical protein
VQKAAVCGGNTGNARLIVALFFEERPYRLPHPLLSIGDVGKDVYCHFFPHQMPGIKTDSGVAADNVKERIV